MVSFYIQTQEEPLPYIYKVYKTARGGRKAILRFLSKHQNEGAIALMDAFHSTQTYFYRAKDGGEVVEEVYDPETYDVAKTVYHGYVS